MSHEKQPSYHPVFIPEPAGRKLLLRSGQIPAWMIPIRGEEYDYCLQNSAKHCSRDIPGVRRKEPRWKHGFVADEVLIGHFGEMAHGKIFNVPVHIAFRKDPKVPDHRFGPYSADDKTAVKRYRSEVGLVKHATEQGVVEPLYCDFYIFAYLENLSHENKSVDVIFVGYSTKGEVMACPIRKSRSLSGTHTNYEVPFSKMHPLNDLKKYLPQNGS